MTLQPNDPRARRALFHRIHRHQYQTAERLLLIGPLQIKFLQIADADAVLDRVADQQSRTGDVNLQMPYWAELWESAQAIGQYLARQRDLRDRSALDLGCGMGLAGTVAARMGMQVLFADREAPALLFARLNSLPDADRVRARRLDWQTDRLDEQFDLIIGADILYERAQWDFLEPFWREHLATDGKVLLGEPGRQTGDQFPDWIRTRGWSFHQRIEPVTTRPTPIRIFELHRQ